MKRRYNLLIGERTAELIKITIGTAYPTAEIHSMEVKGRDLVAGVPKTLEIKSDEVLEALQEPINAVVEAVKIALERTPPELAADIVDKGIVMVGGGALLRNLDVLLREQTGLPVMLAEDPLTAVALGTGRCLDELALLREVDHPTLIAPSLTGSHERVPAADPPAAAVRGARAGHAGADARRPRAPAPGDRALGLRTRCSRSPRPCRRRSRGPVHFVRDTWQRYVALVDLAGGERELRARARASSRRRTSSTARRSSRAASCGASPQMRREFEVPLLPGAGGRPGRLALVPLALLLDRGRCAEVRSGMPVMVDQGLVGLVSATSPHAARAMLILDRRSAVDAMIQRSRARGLVRGLGTGELEFVFMVRGDDVQEGDEVITSGVGGVYPKGIRVGTSPR